MASIYRNISAQISALTRRDWAFFFCLIFCAALLTSKYLLSLCTIGLAVITVFEVQRNPFRISLNKAMKDIQHRIWERKDMIAISLIFFTYFFFGLFSENQAQFWSMVRMKLSFFIWPVLFVLLPRFSRRQYMLLFYLLIIQVSISACIVLAAYLSDAFIFNRALGYGHSLPTPMNHIRYSLLVTLSILGGIVLLKRGFYWRWKWERVIIGGLTVGLFLFQHILSVRTGLALSYVGIIILTGIYGFRSKYRTPFAFAMVIIFCLPLIAYKTIPAFHRKIGYTFYDLDKFRSGEGSGYADTERLRSWQAGLDIVSESPFFGIGFGDVKREVITYYKSRYQSDKYWYPHNQYIAVYVGGGIFGLMLFLFAIIYPLLYRQNIKDELFLVVYTVLLLSMLVESTLNNYIGSSIFLLFILFGLSQVYSSELKSNID